jgi:hypothetical protein
MSHAQKDGANFLRLSLSMKALRVLTLIVVFMFFAAANFARAQFRVEDRLKIGDITVKYDSNRWMLMTDRTAIKARLMCRGQHCGIDIGIEVEEKINVCRAGTVSELLLKRLPQLTARPFTLYEPGHRKERQYGKMTVQMTRAYNGCHVQTDFVFACGEYRGKTYSMWFIPDGCVISASTGTAEQQMISFLFGISAP